MRRVVSSLRAILIAWYVMASDDEVARRELLYAAISDTEGTIRATDAKASFAFVLHGLLFGTLVGVTAQLGSLYADGTCGLRAALIVLGTLFGMSFLLSVIALVRCVAPAPPAAVPKIKKSAGVFFIMPKTQRWRGMSRMPSSEEIASRLHNMDSFAIQRELVGEIVKISAIRARKLKLIALGFHLLIAEIVLALVYVAVIAAAAA